MRFKVGDRVQIKAVKGNNYAYFGDMSKETKERVRLVKGTVEDVDYKKRLWNDVGIRLDGEPKVAGVWWFKSKEVRHLKEGEK